MTMAYEAYVAAAISTTIDTARSALSNPRPFLDLFAFGTLRQGTAFF
jgi:hypothetical protein